MAAHAGFSDPSQFSYHFKRLVGVTPGRFRGRRGVGVAVSAFVFGFRSLSCIPYGSEVWIRVGLQDQRATEARSKFFGP